MKKNIIASSFFLMIVIGLFLTLLMSCSDEIPLYMVRFDSQGGSVVSAKEAFKGSRITEPAAPARANHGFGGWFKDSSCVDAWNFDSDTVTSDITLYAKWVPAYTVFFDSQGGSNIAPLEGIRQGSKITEPTAPTRNGYDFNGWYKDSECTIEWKFGSDTVETSWTLYAKWVVALYSVNFDSLGGTVVPTNEDIEYGAKIREPVSPTRNGYLFDGWYLDSSCTNRWYFTTDTVTSNLTLYAKWLSPHTVVFNSQGGTSVLTINDVAHGNKINAPIPPTRSGSVFDGWYLESTCINEWDFTTDIVTSNLTLYAKWLGPHTVVFNSQEGTIVPAIDDLEHGTTMNEPVVPTRRGYEFDGWHLESSCINRWIFTYDKVLSDITLYAKWLPLHLVSFNSQGGSGVHAIEVPYGKKLNVPESPTKSGYIFDGWYLESSCINQWIFTYDKVLSDITLYAKWIPQYTVFFDSQGGTTPDPDSVTVIYKQAYGGLPNVTKEGYTFGGWWTGEGGTGSRVRESTTVSITSDQILYAVWHLPYTVNFDSQGGSSPNPLSKSVSYDQTYGALPNVTRSGYVFDGWWTGTQGTGTQVLSTTVVSIDGDQTLYAAWNTPAVGEIGQAGGYVFYDKGSYSNGWRYLEAAPARYEYTGKVWGGYGAAVGATGTAIGTGKSNTEKIVARFGNAEPFTNKADYAAKVCADLVVNKDGTVYDDWFLPSKDELDLIFQNLYGNNLGGFSGGDYWSSSEVNANYAWNQFIFNDTQKYYFNRNNAGRVRPVRAF